MTQKILVIGSTGNVGRQVVAQLHAVGTPVRAFVRNPEKAGLPDGVEIAPGDLAKHDTLEAALDGVDAVFLVWPFFTSEGAPDVIATIARHARRIVYLSANGVRDDAEKQSDPITQFHADLERLIKQSALVWTLLRPGGFATNTLGWVRQIREDGVVREPYGAAARSLIHEADIAAVGVRVLTEDGHAGQVYVLSGPQVLSQAEQTETIGAAIGRPVRFEEVPRADARARLLNEGWSAQAADGMLDAYAHMVDHPEPVQPTVRQLTGVPPRTFHEWAVDHAADFR
jgi:uncharacterized protein YbjT (DUF2867 family)